MSYFMRENLIYYMIVCIHRHKDINATDIYTAIYTAYMLHYYLSVK